MYVTGTIRKDLSDKSVAETLWLNGIRAQITTTTSPQKVLTKGLKYQLLQAGAELLPGLTQGICSIETCLLWPQFLQTAGEKQV